MSTYGSTLYKSSYDSTTNKLTVTILNEKILELDNISSSDARLVQTAITTAFNLGGSTATKQLQDHIRNFTPYYPLL
jgi:hypothetical protein